MKKTKLLLGSLLTSAAFVMPLVSTSCKKDSKNKSNKDLNIEDELNKTNVEIKLNNKIDKSTKQASEIKKTDIQLTLSKNIKNATVEIVELKADDNSGTLTVLYKVKKEGKESEKKTFLIKGFKTLKYDFVAINDFGTHKVTIQRIKEFERTGKAINGGTETNISYTNEINLWNDEMKMVNFKPADSVFKFKEHEFTGYDSPQVFYDYNNQTLCGQSGGQPWDGIVLFDVTLPNYLQPTDANRDTHQNKNGYWQSSGYIDVVIESETKITLKFRTYNHHAAQLSEEAYLVTVEITRPAVFDIEEFAENVEIDIKDKENILAEEVTIDNIKDLAITSNLEECKIEYTDVKKYADAQILVKYKITKDNETSYEYTKTIKGFKTLKYDFIAVQDDPNKNYKITVQRVKELERTGYAGTSVLPYDWQSNLSDEEMKTLEIKPLVTNFTKEDFAGEVDNPQLYYNWNAKKLYGKTTGAPIQGKILFDILLPNEFAATDATNDVIKVDSEWNACEYINVKIENETKMSFIFRAYNWQKILSEEAYKVTIELK